MALKKKRKVGRPKKRGPKKKHKYTYVKIADRNKKKKYRTIDWKIISCCNGVQDGRVGCYQKVEEAYAAFNRLKGVSDKVEFPQIVNNSTRTGHRELVHEYLILQKNRDGSKENASSRNEFGKIVPQKIIKSFNNKDWVIFDQFRYNVEETFWVWGYNPKTERKTFRWIYDNIILSGLDISYTYKRVLKYKNKVLVKNDDGFYDIVFCKTTGDAVRFYNLVMELAKKDKLKRLYFMGSYDLLSEKRRLLEDELMGQTGLSRTRIQMKGTRYNR